jgi:hypothetical protein
MNPLFEAGNALSASGTDVITMIHSASFDSCTNSDAPLLEESEITSSSFVPQAYSASINSDEESQMRENRLEEPILGIQDRRAQSRRGGLVEPGHFFDRTNKALKVHSTIDESTYHNEKEEEGLDLMEI